MNEILYFAMGSGFMLMLWASVMFIISWVDTKTGAGFDEWITAYEKKELNTKLESPFVKENGRYYWWDECGLERYGPYDTFEEADKSCTAYAKSLDEIPLGVGGDSAYCFVTGEFIGADVLDMEDNGGCRFTHEFDSWISKKGIEILKDREDNEAKIIIAEWDSIDKEEGELQ